MSHRTVSVTGSGICLVVPDSAVVRVAAITRGSGVAEAFAACTSAVEAIGVVARRHTDEKRIASTGINVWPGHDDLGRPRGYEARHSLTIGCSDLDAAGALLSELVAQIGDALSVDGVSLEVSDPGAARQQAVAAAYEDAKQQATYLAGLAGAVLGETLAIGGPGGSGGGPGLRSMDTMAMAATIEPGETSVDAVVSVTWALV